MIKKKKPTTPSTDLVDEFESAEDGMAVSVSLRAHGQVLEFDFCCSDQELENCTLDAVKSVLAGFRQSVANSRLDDEARRELDDAVTEALNRCDLLKPKINQTLVAAPPPLPREGPPRPFAQRYGRSSIDDASAKDASQVDSNADEAARAASLQELAQDWQNQQSELLQGRTLAPTNRQKAKEDEMQTQLRERGRGRRPQKRPGF
eukprot:TRINITY_DN111222_c0_g1_i1.p1 TRINITY_DN111222_c0_g1~~TRINITY_DN111222_c0_g1_i1.p1  ORF type:complete len:205 (+),score=40.54 TRINITY_DN111222_c0_g1_i1:105-719(+)